MLSHWQLVKIRELRVVQVYSPVAGSMNQHPGKEAEKTKKGESRRGLRVISKPRATEPLPKPGWPIAGGSSFSSMAKQ